MRIRLLWRAQKPASRATAFRCRAKAELRLSSSARSAWLSMLLVLTVAAGAALAEQHAEDGDDPRSPAADDASLHYLFYLHGAWIERYGQDHPHPRHGPYRYEEIVRTLTERGFSVISEVRRGATDVDAYARKTAAEIRRLLDAGVPPSRVTVIGHSKGGQIALRTACELKERGVNFVIMAGCGRPGSGFGRSYEQFLETHAARLRGRMLSLVDSSDRVAGSCQRAFERAPGLQRREQILETGRGHALFYTPHPVWIDQVVAWGLTKSQLQTR